MKKSLYIILVVLLMGTVGCESYNMSNNLPQEPPDITVTIGDKQLEYVMAKNKWNGSIYDREDTFVTILGKQNEVPIFKKGDKVEISFKDNPPDKFTVYDILIDKNGGPIYTDKEIKEISHELHDGKYTFEIENHFASALSSNYEPNKEELRGFRMIASWNENECEYAFVIKTISK